MTESTNDQKYFELLPWYVNNTLSPEERQNVELWLEHSVAGRKEVVLLTRLQEETRRAVEPFQATDFGWQQMKRKIHAESSPPAKQSPSMFGKLAAIAATVIIGIQTMLLVGQHNQLESTRLLSGSPTVTNQAQNQYLMQMQFRRGASFEQVAEFLQMSQARIIDGPSALNLVTVSIAQNNLPDNIDNQQQLLDWLNSQAIVEHAQLTR